MPLIRQVEELKIGNEFSDRVESVHCLCVLIPHHFPNVVPLLEIGHEQRKAKEYNDRGSEIEPYTVPRDNKAKRHNAYCPDCTIAEETPSHERAQRKQWHHCEGRQCLSAVRRIKFEPKAENDQQHCDRGDGSK